MSAEGNPPPMDLTHAVLIGARHASAVEQKAVDLLLAWVRARTGVLWHRTADGVPKNQPVVVVARDDNAPQVDGIAPPALPSGDSGAPHAEGCALSVERAGGRPVVFALGADDRGVLFAVGRLLRLLRMRESRVEIDGDASVSTAPDYPVRGHQLGYRPKSNAYDAWDLARFEQYIRDLIIFGTNAIEIIPSIAPDDEPGRNEIMPADPWEMTVALTRLIASYALDVRMWLPLTDGDVCTPEGRRTVLDNRRRLFEACQRIDAVFVPGGDPGDLAPADLLPFLEQMAALLREYHPAAEVWVSPQGFDEENLAAFYRVLSEQPPDWLDGVVYGPWVRDTLAHLRQMVPDRYPVQDYPDITHTVRCQYPVPGWDPALAMSLNREPINPRPTQYAHIHRVTAPLTVGFVSYSDGANDDVNKILWSALAWDSEADVRQTLVEFGRVFIGEAFGESVADGLLALEANWEGPLAGNQQIAKTLALWQAMEKRAPPQVQANWRFQQGLFRAYADAYVQQRLKRETRLEQQALRALAKAGKTGADPAIVQARSILARADSEPAAPRLLRRIDELADDLRQSIGMQLSVARHDASAWDRGATLDTLGASLNNRAWIESELDALAGEDEADKLAGIERIVSWEDPGPGGFYDDLGDPGREPRLVREPGWESDPGFVLTAHDAHEGPRPGRQSWQHVGQTLFGRPLRLRYEGLDPNARYRLRVTYAGRFRTVVRLVANRGYEVHPPLGPGDPIAPCEFDLPCALTAAGALELTWTLAGGPGVMVGRGTLITGPQVAEVWLIRA